MMPTKLSVPGRRHASKAYASLTAGDQPRQADPRNRLPVVRHCALQSANAEIGSLPINALAIALALTAGTIEAQ